MRYPAFVAEMAMPANRPKLWFGIWTGFAVAIGFGILAAAAAFFDLTPWRWAYVGLVSTKLLTNSLAWLGLKRDRFVMETQGLNTVADVMLLTAAIYFTGGPYSPLLATYVIVIAVLSLLANLGVTILMAALIVASFATMVICMVTGVLPPTPVPGAPGVPPSAGYAVTSILYCALVVGVPAFFSSTTLRILRAKERDLEKRTAELIQVNTQRSQFIASMTHELRTPIHGVQGLADVIAAGVYGPVTDKQKDACASIKRSAQNLLGLVDDVLNLARAEANRIEARPRAVDIAALVERVTASVSWMVGTKRIQLDAVVAKDLSFVQSDDRWLAHVLVNLVSNAVKFTPEGGNVVVRAFERPDDHAVALEVVDSGIGIAREDRERIFEPFRQGDSSDEKGFGGVGLGLALVARLTDLLGATVELDSEVGKGSTFRVLVPLDWRGRPVSRLMRAVTAPEGVKID
ncbi:MAG TPA: HAMP domain-containing sensor histidine kinase [Kofleriaceae bacterium]|nr:HAMP domain-containing sensor histidine kinase [Kofleriaceae bacterium]